MNTWKVVLATMLIFGTGVITGGLLVRHSDRVRPVRPPARPTAPRNVQPPTPQVMRLEFLKRVERDLDLTPEQQQQADKLIKESQERSKKITEPVAPLLREELQRTREAFRALLTPEQRVRFEELLKHPQHPRDPHRPGATNSPAALTNSP
jgi:hypothetical protein